MLPTDPLKIDLIRLEVVRSCAGAAADPRGRELELSIEGSFMSLFLWSARQRSLVAAIAGAVPSRGRPGLEGLGDFFERKAADGFLVMSGNPLMAAILIAGKPAPTF
jgi:hypothetical protein